MQAAPPLSTASSVEKDVISPSPRSPTKACQLTSSMIVRATNRSVAIISKTELCEGFQNLPASSKSIEHLTRDHGIAATGEEALEELEELEMIFGGVSELGGLDRCFSLRSLTLIDCGLRRISNLEPVRHSLVKLCLCDQGLKKMENLHLPGLRELYLHENKIAKIEGLHGCPSLRRLWLFANRISKVEGLHHCGDIRELLLHGNRIPTAGSGLESLVHLQYLGLAGNPIGDLRELSGLRDLPSLVELTLNDIHFGTCPVVKMDGYRDFVVCYLRQVQRCDGVTVLAADRMAVEKKYEQEALAYQERLEDIEQTRLQEIRQAEMARDGGEERGSEVKAEMMRALEDLEELVREGRESLAGERSRQEEIEAANLEELKSGLSELRRQYRREADKRVRVEEAKSVEEERLFAALEKRACLERDYVLFVALQQSQGPATGLAVQELSAHSPEFQSLRAEVWASQKTQSGQVEPMNVLRACRLYNRRLCEEFLTAAGEDSSTIRLYLCLSGKDVDSVCRAGLAALGQPAVVLYQDPKLATSRADIVRQGSALRSSKSHGDAPPGGSADDGAATSCANDLRVVVQFAVVPSLEWKGDVEETPAPGEGMEAGVEGPAGGDRRSLPPTRSSARSRPGGAGKGSRTHEIAGKERHEEGDEPSGFPVGRATASGCTKRMGFSTSGSQEALPEDEGTVDEDDGVPPQDGLCCVLPTRRFALALPEFHMLCASGAAGEDVRALDDALAELSADHTLGPAPEKDLLAQIEAKMEEQVKAYLERMQQDVTPEEASELQETDANIRWKTASLNSLRAGVDDERAIQEALISEGSARF